MPMFKVTKSVDDTQFFEEDTTGPLTDEEVAEYRQPGTEPMSQNYTLYLIAYTEADQNVNYDRLVYADTPDAAFAAWKVAQLEQNEFKVEDFLTGVLLASAAITDRYELVIYAVSQNSSTARVLGWHTPELLAVGWMESV